MCPSCCCCYRSNDHYKQKQRQQQQRCICSRRRLLQHVFACSFRCLWPNILADYVARVGAWLLTIFKLAAAQLQPSMLGAQRRHFNFNLAFNHFSPRIFFDHKESVYQSLNTPTIYRSVLLCKLHSQYSHIVINWQYTVASREGSQVEPLTCHQRQMEVERDCCAPSSRLLSLFFHT